MRLMPVIRAAVLPWAFALAVMAAEATSQLTTVTPEEADTLRAAAAATDPAQAIAVLAAHRGPPHALLDLALAQAEHRAADAAGEATAKAAHRTNASTAYRQALVRDPGLRAAHLGLARLAVDRDDWAAALVDLGAGLDASSASAGEWLFYASAAQRAGDRSLAESVARSGMTRFPAEPGFRRVLLALFVGSARVEEARQVALDLLAAAPDADLLQTLAWCEERRGDRAAALAALEAAQVLKPDDRALARSLAEYQLAAGQPQAAFAGLRALLGAPLRPADLADAGLMGLAARAAAEADEPVQARAWLDAVPDGQRDRTQRLLAARLALQAGDNAMAATALDALVQLGERDPAVLAWAGATAEQVGDAARAEALYQQAIAADPTGKAPAASVRLAALWLKQGRRSEAAALIADHLRRHPQDEAALALSRAIAAR